MVIAANQDNVFRRLCEAMGRPELADDPRFATHLARGENQEEIEGDRRRVGARSTTRAEIDRVLNEAGVVCGPIYTIADIFEDPQFAGARDARRARRPRVRAVHRAGHRPEVLRDARARCGGRAPGRRAATTRRSTAGCSGSPTRSSTRCERMASYDAVTICDVGPRDGLQNEPVTLEPAVRAELVDRLAAAGVPRIEAVSFVNPERVPQMAGAEEVVAAIERRDGRRLRRPRAERARLRPPARRGPRRGALRLRGDRGVQPAQPGRDRSRRRRPPAERIVERAHADGIRATVTIGVAFGCPFEGAVDPGRVLGARRRGSRLPGADEIVLADTVGVGVPRQVRDLVAPDRAARRPGRRPPPQHAQHRLRERVSPRSRRARRSSTRRSAGSAAARSRRGRRGTSRPRTSSTSSTARASRRASTSSALIDVATVARIACSGASSRVRSTRPARSRRSPADRERTARWRTGWGSTSVARSPTSSSSPRATAARSSASRRRRRPTIRRRACSPASAGSATRPGIGVGELQNILHGTTVATNAVLESKGARVGLITTQGLRPDPPPGALADAGAAGGLDHHDQARSAGVARRHARGGRAARRARERRRPGRRGAGRGDRPRPGRLRASSRSPSRSSTRTSTRRTRSRSARSSSVSTRASRSRSARTCCPSSASTSAR